MKRGKFNGKATGQLSCAEYNRRCNLVRTKRACWLPRRYHNGAGAAADAAGIP